MGRKEILLKVIKSHLNTYTNIEDLSPSKYRK